MSIEESSCRPSSLLIALLAAFVLGAFPAQAQDQLSDAPFDISVELNSGAAFYSHFLEQRGASSSSAVRERELTAGTDAFPGGRIDGFSFGAAVGVRLFERNVVRLSLDYLPGSFEYEDDTGDRKVTEFNDANFQLFAASLEAERTFFQVGRFAPYASVGLSGGWWHLDESSEPGFENSITAGDSENVFRWGSTSGIGIRVEITPSLYLNLEGNALSIGNPFDGSDAFQVGAPETTFDEPTSINVVRVRGGLRYIF